MASTLDKIQNIVRKRVGEATQGTYNTLKRANDSSFVRNFNTSTNRLFDNLGDITGANKGVPALINLAAKTNPTARRQINTNPILKERLQKATGYGTTSNTQDVLNAAKFGTSFVGAPKLGLSALSKGGLMGIGGTLGLGGTINKVTGGSFTQGVADTARNLPSLYGVTGLTGPVINKAVGSLSSKANNPLTRGVVNRLSTGALNVPEGMAVNQALGQGGYTPTDLAVDFGSGVLLGSQAPQGIAKGLASNDLKLDSLLKQQKMLESKRVGMLDNGIKPKSPAYKAVDRELNKILVEINRLKRQGSISMGIVGDSKPQIKPSKEFIGRDYNPPLALEKTKNQIGTLQDEPKKNLKQRWDDFYTQVVNRDAPIENLVDKIEKKNKISIRPEFNPKYTIKRLLGAGGVAEYRHKKELEPIINKLKTSNIDKGDFDAYLKAKRDLELSSRDIKGSDPEQARQTMEALSAKYNPQQLDEISQDLYKYQDKNLQMLQESGFLSEDAVKNIRSLNQSYVPFERIMGTELENYLGLPSSVRQNPGAPVKGIKGSDKQIYSPLESIIANTYKVEAATAKNNVSKSIVGLGKVSPEYKELFVVTDKAGPNSIAVWENGQKVYYDTDKEIAEAVKGMNEEQANLVVTLLSAPAKLLRQQATGRNLEFMLPNIVRDQMDAAINAKYGYIPFLDYFIGVHDLIKFKMGADNTFTEAWIQNGGKMFFENMGGRKELREQMNDAKGKSLLKKLTSWVTGGIDVVGEFSETPTRLGIYRRAMKATKNPAIAAYESREGTLDFARMGGKMKVANSIIPFLNVSVQGFDKMIRSFKDRPAKTTFLLTVYGGLPALATTMYNVTFHKDDYEQVPDFEKDGNFIIMTGEYDPQGNPMYWKIPKGHIVATVANPTQRALEYMSGANPQTFSQFAYSFLSSTLPVVGEGSNFTEVASNTVGGLLPQAVKPTVETLSNYSFYKSRPIVPNYLQNKPASAQFTKNTPEGYVRVGEATGVSPMKLQNFVEGTFAGAVKQPQNLLDTARMATGENEYDPNKVFVGRRFKGSYTGFDTERPNTESTADLGALFRPDRVGASENMPQLDEKSTKRADSLAKRWGYDSYMQPEPQDELEYEVYRNNLLKDAKAVFNEENIKDQDRLNMITRMGFDYEEVKLDVVANSTVTERAMWVRDQIKNMPPEEIPSYLIGLYTNKTLSDSRIFTDSVAEKLGLGDIYDIAKNTGKAKKPKKLKLKAPTAKAIKVRRGKAPNIFKNSSTGTKTPNIDRYVSSYLSNNIPISQLKANSKIVAKMPLKVDPRILRNANI